MVEVLVFGSAIVDFICYVDRLPKVGETLHGNKFATGFGGKGANQCVAAARMGAKTALIAKLGEDAWGHNYLQHLRKEEVCVDFIEKCQEHSTGIAQITVSGAGENVIVIVVGANNELSDADVFKAKDLFDSAKILVCQFETPMDATLTALRSFKGTSILNAAPALANTPKELIEAATILCVNETEAALMTGLKEVTTLEQAKTALQGLIAMGGNIVILTLGALGAAYVKRSNPEFVHVPAVKVAKVVDTTGAGDAFIGSLSHFLARFPTSPLHQQIGAACEIAAYSVQRPGTQSSFPVNAEVNIDLARKSYKWFNI